MVKQTFLKLSENKRKNIIDVAKKEFAAVPLHKASINKIIKELGLARGSFYNYFDNIEDLYFYILTDFRDNVKNKLSALIDENNGDVFEGFIEIFDYILESNKDEVDRDITKNLFLNFSSNNKNFISPRPEMCEIKEHIKALYKKIDTKNLKVKNDMELFEVIQMLKDNLFQNIMHYFMFNMPEQIMKEKYINRINIIKYGICKGEK